MSPVRYTARACTSVGLGARTSAAGPYLDFLSEHRHITAASVPLIYQFGPWPLLIVMSVLFAVALVGGTIDRRRLVAAGSADAVHARHALAGRSSVVANTDQRLYRGGR